MASEAQACVDEEITKQVVILCNLRTRRNTFSPVSRLPVETLATIFVHCARNYHYADLGYFPSTVPLWVNVSYVCRHWRHVALDCPTLWTYLFFTSPWWTEELLVRSKQALLKLHMNWTHCGKQSYGLHPVEEVMNHVARLQELHLDLPATLTRDVLSELSSSAPRLQILKIWVDDVPQQRSRFLVLFRGDTPALRTLHLTNCPVPWYSLNLNGLTTLSISDVPVQFQQSIPEFLATLSCMQDLTQLNLEDALASAAGFLSSVAFNAYQKIDLPYLSRLSIAAPLSMVITLLSCVNIPSKTVVKLKCNSEHDSSLDHHVLLSSVLAQRLSMLEDQALSGPVIRALAIDNEGGETGLTFSVSECEREREDFFCSMRWNWDCDSPLQIFFDSKLSMEMSDGNNIISNICCSMPLPNVQSLYAYTPPYSPAFWRKMLGHFDGLRRLKLSVGDMPDVASVLSVTSPTTHEDEVNQAGRTPPSDQVQDHILVPRLEELVLEEISFSPEDDPDTSGHFITQSRLFDALSTRNAPPGRLIMTGCDIDGLEELDVTDQSWGDLVVVIKSGSDSMEDGSDPD